MPEYKYQVIIENEVIVKELALEHALILVKALFDEYYKEPNLKISIQKIGEAIEGY